MRSFRTISLLLLACLWTIVIPGAHAQTSQTQEVDSLTVFIGTGGVMWEYVNEEDTPNLFALSGESSIGNLSVRGTYPAACPADGWLTLGAGERAGDGVADSGRCRILEEPVDGRVPHWDEYVAATESSSYQPILGQLADLTNERSTLAVGPGAALALADENGHVTSYGNLDELPELLDDQELVLIDLGAITEKEQVVFEDTDPRATNDPGTAAFIAPDWDEERIRSELAELDAELGRVLEIVEEEMPGARIIVASISDYSATATTLQVIMERTGEPGLITSSTTRRAGLVNNTDLLPTLADGHEGPGMAIQASIGGTAEDNRDVVTEFDTLSQAIKPATGWVFAMWGTFWILTLLATLLLRRRRVVHGAALAVASVPASAVLMNFLPWHESAQSTVVLCVGIALLSAVIGTLALVTGKHGRTIPAAVIATLTLVVYLWPVLVGSPLALNSAFGALPAVGRFYGMNNMMFAIVAAAGLVLAGVIAERVRPRNRAALIIAILGVIIIFIDGSPWHGTDFGGPPILTVAFLFLALLVSGRKLTWLSALGMLLAGVLVAASFLLVDYLRPLEERTHLGDFAQSLLDGTAFDVVWRKAGAMLAQWPLMLVLAVGCLVFLYVWKKKGPALPSLGGYRLWLWVSISIAISLVGGMLLNDSGAIIVLVGGMVAIPLIASVLYFAGHPSSALTTQARELTDPF